MKGSAEKNSGQHQGMKRSIGLGPRLHKIAVLGGIAILALVFGSMLVGVPFFDHRPQEANGADSPQIKGIENPKNRYPFEDHSLVFSRSICQGNVKSVADSQKPLFQYP